MNRVFESILLVWINITSFADGKSYFYLTKGSQIYLFY